MSLLEIRNLRVEFGSRAAPFAAVRGLDLDVQRGELLGIVGESGSGKSVAMLALMGLIDAPGRVSANRIALDGQDLLALSPRERRKVLGRDMAMIFQDPMTSLNPSYTVGFQIIETLAVHEKMPKARLRERAIELLRQVEIPDAELRLDAYPHQLSGGMSQRVMIAMALACRPKLLIADEPTTALDVTIQAQVLELLVNLQRQHEMGLVLITHDLALLARHARRVAVMYAGEVVEVQTLPELFDRAHHPYTEALLAAIPERSRGARRLPTLAGRVPGHHDKLAGCLLAPRCRYADDTCRLTHPELTTLDDASQVRCLKPLARPVTSGDVARNLAARSTGPSAQAAPKAPSAPAASGLPSGASA